MRQMRKNHHRRKKPEIRIQPRRKLPERIQTNQQNIPMHGLPNRIQHPMEPIHGSQKQHKTKKSETMKNLFRPVMPNPEMMNRYTRPHELILIQTKGSHNT